jgi:hypothetical protein
MFKTKEGHFGLAPSPARPGDVVTILLGCESAMILRPYGNEQFKVVGEGYCQGFMWGEALLGQFSGRFEPLMRYDEDAGIWRWAYINRETGVIQEEDPRLGKLPEGWEKRRHKGEEYWSWFANDEKGLSGTDDPRLGPNAFRKRGVPLRVFELI